MTAITELVSIERRGRVAVLTIDNPPLNALSHGVRQGLKDGIVRASREAGVSAIVITGAGRTFTGGADTAEFRQPPREPGLWELLELIEGAAKPVIAALPGADLFLGLELALACHYRVGAKGARFGIPEVKLGLVPGAGGTQRLPRVVGVEPALQMIASGELIDADEALRHGLVDAIVEDDLIAGGVAFAERVVRENRPLRKTRDLHEKVEAERGKPEIFASFRASVATQTRGFKAPEYCIRAVEAAVNLPFAQGLDREREPLRRPRELAGVEGPALPVRGRARGRPDPRRSRRHRGQRSREGRRHRCRHHGRRHRHELRECRHPGHAGRDRERIARPRPRRHPPELREHGGQGTADRAGRRDPDGAHHRHHGLERRRRGRPRHRGGVRGDGSQEGGLRKARRDRQARRGPGHEHLRARRRRDRRRHPPAAIRHRHAFRAARPT